MPAHDCGRYRIGHICRDRVVGRHHRCRRPKGLGRGHDGDRMMTIIGYARVSTDGQSLDAQRAALKSAGCAKIFAEKQSGVVTGRKELMRALDALGAGDVLVVTRLDRLARSTRDLLNVLHTIADKTAGFKSLA